MLATGWAVLLACLALPFSAQAYCRSYIEDGSRLRYSYVCENTYAAPKYTIVRQYIGEDEQAFMEFAPKEAGILCSSGVFGGHSFRDCHSYTPTAFAEEIDGGIGPVSVYLLPGSMPELQAAYLAATLFAYPDLVEAVADQGCAVTISKERRMNIFFNVDNPEPLGECLLQFELHATTAWRDYAKID